MNAWKQISGFGKRSICPIKMTLPLAIQKQFKKKKRLVVCHGGLALLRAVGMLCTEGNSYEGSHCSAGDSLNAHFNCPTRYI